MQPDQPSPRGILAIWNDRRADADEAYEGWYRGEHLPERLSVPGFRAAWRYRALVGEPEYFTFYETDTPEVLFSGAYEARVNDPTPLTCHIMSGIFANATRALMTCSQRWGFLRGALAVSARFEAQPPRELAEQLKALVESGNALRAELWTATRAPAPSELSAEQKLRGPDKSIAAAALLEATTESEARTLSRALGDMLSGTAHVGAYRLFCSIDARDLRASK